LSYVFSLVLPGDKLIGVLVLITAVRSHSVDAMTMTMLAVTLVKIET